MKRNVTATVFGIILVGVLASIAAVSAGSPSGVPDLKGKTVIFDSVNPPTENLTLGVIGEREFVVLRLKRDDGLSFEAWKPLENVSTLMVFDSMEDAVKYRAGFSRARRSGSADQETEEDIK